MPIEVAYIKALRLGVLQNLEAHFVLLSYLQAPLLDSGDCILDLLDVLFREGICHILAVYIHTHLSCPAQPFAALFLGSIVR